jgi:hypothetical protein
MKRILFAIFAGVSILSAYQVNPPAPPVASKRFHKLDKDGDGRLSLDEFKAVGKDSARRERRFRKLDANHDGYLSPDEFAAGIPPQAPPTAVSPSPGQ